MIRGNLRPGVFGLIKMSFRAEKRSAKIFGKEIRPKFFGEMDKNALVISKRLKFP